MRYLLSLVLVLSACTRANPDAIGANGGSAGGGGGGSAGNGGGGMAGGGGKGGGGADLAMPVAHDMTTGPADMTSFAGVFCGNMICMAPSNECCASQVALVCQSPAVPCSGAPFDCDGPEDCAATDTCCGGTGGSMCVMTNGGGCQNGDVPLCHTLADCPKSDGGFAACCASPQGGHLRFCSKNPC